MGGRWELEGSFKRKGTYVYLRLIHVDEWQKPTQHCKAIILQLKINKYKENICQKSDTRFTSCFSPLVSRAGEVMSPEAVALGRLSLLHCILIETSFDLPLSSCNRQPGPRPSSHLSLRPVLSSSLHSSANMTHSHMTLKPRCLSEMMPWLQKRRQF